MSKVIVIGGGASGMMAAYAAAKSGHMVTLLERNEKTGKKIYITGKGRCNFTNDAPIEDFFGKITTNPKFMFSAFHAFDNEDIKQLMQENGTPWKVERGERVFPVSDHASDVTAALMHLLKKYKVKVQLNSRVEEILVQADGDSHDCKQKVMGVKLADGSILEADAVIVATGGLSYPSTGSTGDGYTFAKNTGHRLTICRPSLVALTCSDPEISSLEGLSLRNVNLLIKNKKGKKIFSAFGEMLFTHDGISGPIVLSASSKIGKTLEKEGSLSAEIDLKPALSEEQLDQRMLREMQEKQNKTYHNLFSGVLPSKIIPVIQARTEIPLEKKVNNITRRERHEMVELMKHFPLAINGTGGFRQAVITQGGVSVKDIDPKTMESKLVNGLYFAGEVIDVDALTGGFNLQIAWSTGYLAGISVK